MAYINKESLLTAYKVLSQNTSNPSNQGATQCISAIRYLFALDRFMFKNENTCDTKVKEDKELLIEMVEYLKTSQNDELAEKYNIRPGVGLAANQIGIKKRMIAIYFEEEDKIHQYALVNPKIVSYSVKQCCLDNGEGCLSVPKDEEGYVYRYYKVTVKGYDALT